MKKYIEILNEIDFIMNKMLESFDITLEEKNAYPFEDMLRIVLNSMDVDSLKSINFMLEHDDFLEYSGIINKNIHTFIYWWAENLDLMIIDVPEIISSKEKGLLNVKESLCDVKDKKRL